IRLSHSETSPPRTRDDLQAMIAAHREPPPVASSAGGVAMAAVDNVIRPNSRMELDLALYFLCFRGSPAHCAVVLLAIVSVGYAVQVSILSVGYYSFALLMTVFVPSMVLYLSALAHFATIQHSFTVESRIAFSRWYQRYNDAYRAANLRFSSTGT